jgi:D-glycero-D-manno-heptose 1,7-bisphosphate phosphatase
MTRRAAFLDRDGVVNVDRGYLHRWEDFEFLPGAVAAMRRLQAAGFALVVVTNQSGIARGYYDEDAFVRLTDAMWAALVHEGVSLAAVEWCPHHPRGSVARYAIACDCRKPEPGMILRAARALDIDLAASVLFGDKPSDIEAASRAGVGRAILVAPNAGAGSPDDDVAAVPEFGSLAEAVDAFLG